MTTIRRTKTRAIDQDQFARFKKVYRYQSKVQHFCCVTCDQRKGPSMTQHKQCYGTMFHDSLHFTPNDRMQGKVFAFELDSVGLARTDRQIQANLAEWDDCIACPEFDHCYKLCMAKLSLESAISGK